MSDTQVYVTTLASGTAIDNVSVTTNAGSVNRQRTTERDLVTEIDASGTIGTTATTAIAAGAATNWVDIENTSFASAQLLGYRFDGVTPTWSGSAFNAGTFVLLPGGTKTYDKRIPTGTLQVCGSASGTTYVIKYA